MPSFSQKICCSHTQSIFQRASALIYYRPVFWQKLLKIHTFHKCEKFSLIDTKIAYLMPEKENEEPLITLIHKHTAKLMQKFHIGT